MLAFTPPIAATLVTVSTVLFTITRIKVQRITTRGIITSVTSHCACVTVRKEAGGAMRLILFMRSYAKDALTILIPISLPLPTIIRIAHINLGPKAGNFCIS